MGLRSELQPAEEPGRGAQAIVDDGLFERFPVDRLFGIHNIPGTPAGHLRTRPGHVMASEDSFTIHVNGRGGHASAPHLVVDPLVIGAEIVLALQHVVAEPIMASEDFGVLGRHVPACLAFLGNGTEPDAGGVPLHSHGYVFNDDTLAAGVAYYREVVTESLAED